MARQYKLPVVVAVLPIRFDVAGAILVDADVALDDGVVADPVGMSSARYFGNSPRIVIKTMNAANKNSAMKFDWLNRRSRPDTATCGKNFSHRWSYHLLRDRCVLWLFLLEREALLAFQP